MWNLWGAARFDVQFQLVYPSKWQDEGLQSKWQEISQSREFSPNVLRSY